MSGGVPIVGQVKPAPPYVFQNANGETIAMQQVVTSEMSMGLVDLIAAKAAQATLDLIKSEFDLFPKKPGIVS